MRPRELVVVASLLGVCAALVCWGLLLVVIGLPVAALRGSAPPWAVFGLAAPAAVPGYLFGRWFYLEDLG